jgi:hypothetical protein
MDPSRGKRKNKTTQRSRSIRPVQKSGDNSLQAAKEKAPPKSQESKTLGEWMHIASPRLYQSLPLHMLLGSGFTGHPRIYI